MSAFRVCPHVLRSALGACLNGGKVVDSVDPRVIATVFDACNPGDMVMGAEFPRPSERDVYIVMFRVVPMRGHRFRLYTSHDEGRTWSVSRFCQQFNDEYRSLQAAGTASGSGSVYVVRALDNGCQ